MIKVENPGVAQLVGETQTNRWYAKKHLKVLSGKEKGETFESFLIFRLQYHYLYPKLGDGHSDIGLRSTAGGLFSALAFLRGWRFAEPLDIGTTEALSSKANCRIMVNFQNCFTEYKHSLYEEK